MINLHPRQNKAMEILDLAIRKSNKLPTSYLV